MSLNAAAANKMLDHILAGSWVSLHSAETGISGANELRGRQYRRQRFGNGPAVGGKATNREGLGFAFLPAGAVTHVAVWDEREAGTMIFSEELPKDANGLHQILGQDDSYRIEAGMLWLALRL